MAAVTSIVNALPKVESVRFSKIEFGKILENIQHQRKELFNSFSILRWPISAKHNNEFVKHKTKFV